MAHVNKTITDFDYLSRCIQLANSSTIVTSPNPSVGAVLVAQNRVIGEGFTQRDGGAHAEVMAFTGVNDADQHLLGDATLYVSLEPCSIFGRTPPCCDLIIEKRIKRVVIGCIDFTKGVLGQGLERIRKAGIEVSIGIAQDRAFEYSKYRQAITRRNRPYVILKQAISADGYVGVSNQQLALTGKMANTLSHQWRSQVDAILVGANTVEIDDPSLTTRFSPGRSPARVILDPRGRVALSKQVLATAEGPRDSGAEAQELPTFWAVDAAFAKTCRSKIEEHQLNNVIVLSLKRQNRIQSLLDALLKLRVGRLLVEGGPTTLRHFVEANAYDEYREWTTPTSIGSGQQAIAAAKVYVDSQATYAIGNDVLTIGRNMPTFTNC